MAGSVVNFSSVAGATTSLSCPMPTGTVQGDVMVAAVASDWDTYANVTAPAGWTLRTGQDGGSNNIHLKVFTKTAGASEAGPYAFTQGASSDGVAAIVTLRGVDESTAVGLYSSTLTVSTSTTRTAPTISGATTGAVLVCGAMTDGAGLGVPLTYTPPAGMIEQVDASSGNFTAETIATLLAPANPSGTKDFTTSAAPVATGGIQWSAVFQASGSTDPGPTWFPRTPGLFRAPGARFPQPWAGVPDYGAAATPTAAEQGNTPVGAIATGTAVKVAKVVGVCSVGAVGTGTAVKVGVQSGPAATGAVATGVEAKVGVSTGATTLGATATGLESTAIVATPRPAVTVLAAPRTPAYGRTPGARVVTGLPHGLAAPAAETGASTAGAVATGTAVKVAKVVGTCSLAAVAVGTAKKSAPITSAGTAGAVITAVEKKAAAALGTATAGAAGTGTQTGAVTATRTPTVLVLTARRAPAYDRPGQVILGSTPAVDDPVTTTAELGRATVGATATGAVVKVAKVAGTCALAASSTGAAKKVTAARGTATVGVVARHSGVVARALAGVCAVATGALGALRKNATPTGTTPVGAAGRGTQGRISRVVGLAALATSTRGVQARRSSVAGATTTGVAAVGTGGKRTGARGITCLAIISTGRTFTPSAPIQGSPNAGVIVDRTTTRAEGLVLDQVPRRSATAVLDETEPLTGEGVVSRVVQHHHGGATDNVTHFDTV